MPGLWAWSRAQSLSSHCSAVNRNSVPPCQCSVPMPGAVDLTPPRRSHGISHATEGGGVADRLHGMFMD